MKKLEKVKRGALIAGATVLFASCGDSKAGDKCEKSVCTSDNTLLSCEMGLLVDRGKVDENTCNCTNGSSGCAIPGFVGVRRAAPPVGARRHLRTSPVLA
jgi:hypothetical protein